MNLNSKRRQYTMEDHPYTTPDEDPFNVRPIVQQIKPIKHRRPSLLDKWILEQQQSPTEYLDALHRPGLFSTSDASSTASFSNSNPYLAYPDLPRVPPIDTAADKDTASIYSYDLVNDDDIPAKVTVARDDAATQDPPIPTPARATKTFRQSFSPAFRHINLPFRSPTPSKVDPSSSSSYRAFSRLSIFQRTPRSSSGISSDKYNTHSKTSTVLTRDRSISQHSSNSNLNFHSPRTNPKWRPSVLGHFYQPSVSQSSVTVSETHSTPSRPSISSDTFSTSRTATTIESNVLLTPPKILAQDPLGFASSTSALSLPTASRSSIWLPSHGFDSSSRVAHCQTLTQHRTKFIPEFNDDDPISFRARHHDTIRASIPYSSSGTLPRVNFSSLNPRSQRKKKKLVISGVSAGDTQKFEGIKRWCESFGHVRQIVRMPNGDLHIDFQDSEVADTVCRVRARVHIAGVGSVQLSWFTGNKP